MCRFLFFVVVFCFFQGINSLIVPDEVPSLLSLIYSNIPPIRKGTDSRLGWGFRLGDHADFQILVELGPQTNTRPLGNEGDKNNKRNVANNLRNTLYAQTQLLKERQRQQQEERDQISNTDGGKWIESWSTQMKESSMEEKPLPMVGIGEVDASKVFPAELEDLYGKRQSKNIQRIAPSSGKTTSTTTTEKTLENSGDGQGKSFLAKLAGH